MSGEARSMWERFITAPENSALLKRYAKSAKEPAPLFESIGEDLASSNEKVRTEAFWALVTAMPVLTNILHERETRQPGWRDVKGKDQQMANRGSDILSYLHRVLVKEHRFKIRGENDKDLRLYVNKAINNWKRDEERKRKNQDGILREVPLDYEATLEIVDPGDSVEDSVLAKIAYEECKREIRGLRFLKGENELNLFETVYVDERPLEEVRESLGIPSELALRQRLSRGRKNFVADRDALFSFCLLGDWGFSTRGQFPRFPSFPESSEWWAERARQSVQPGFWLKGLGADGKNVVAIQPLTKGLKDSPAHIYLLATHKYKDYRCELYYDKRPLSEQLNEFHKFVCDEVITLDDCYLQYVDKLINPTSRGLQPNRYMYCYLDSYPTELPGLNEAIAKVHGDYNIWLISNSLPDPRLELIRKICSKRYVVLYSEISRYGSSTSGHHIGPWRLGQGEGKLNEDDGEPDIIRYEKYL